MSCLAGPGLSVLRHSCYREYNVGDTLEYEVRALACYPHRLAQHRAQAYGMLACPQEPQEQLHLCSVGLKGTGGNPTVRTLKVS